MSHVVHNQLKPILNANGVRPPQSPPRPAPVVVPQSGPPPTAGRLGAKLLTELDRSWQKAQTESEKRIRALQPDARRLVELQSTVQQLGFGAQLLTQTAEAVNGTVRRVQQLGGS